MRAGGNLRQRERFAAEEFFEQLVVLLGAASRGCRGPCEISSRNSPAHPLRPWCAVEDFAEPGFLPERHFKRDAILPEHLPDLLDDF